ncbi:hypothetical protein GYMLUDRAFT_248037 [Collybiopsis luxurians FD-317 M1]|uniref:Uncharacterized protein n=1 Tax=Collybiopsis luxurians FD-317 M1 TaxID=944289 RepID=A0A0D0AZV6_9AGAR|nr:hypothetical protein GYMLUDRAFT_248037 [Collybiopsis luxurians FD-317 M1]
MEGREWDPWANGHFWVDVTHEEFTQTKNLGVHWATKNSSFHNGKGSVHSSTVDGAKVTAKKCLGVIACSNESCIAIFHPHISPENHAKQQIRNDISTLRYRYINGPPHSHSHIPDVACTTAAEDKRFKAAYESHPNATPTQMMAGAPAPSGYGPGAAELGYKFCNQDYTGYLLWRLHARDGNGPTSAFGVFNKLGEWKALHSDVFCQDFTSSNMVCISLQTEWMWQQVLPDMADVEDPLHGILSDAPHKYWEDPNGHLIVSSIFSPLLVKWVPVLFTYANGATADHYQYHFLILIQRVAQTAIEWGLEINDDIFAGVVDFSDPQWNGFVNAFVAYFLAQSDDYCSESQLWDVAGSLLKDVIITSTKASIKWLALKSLGWAPSGRYWDQYSGSIQQWFNAVTQMNQAMSVESQSGCWRQEHEDDKITSICAGESQQIEFITDIPVLLNLAPDIAAGKFWDFPIELFIGPKASAHKRGLVYGLVGMVLTNGNHYIALTVIPTSSNNKVVFAYDGMKNQGHSKYKSGKVTELLTGQPPACAPPGFTTNTVLYKLRGGTAARNLFQSLQVANAKMHLNVSLENPLLPSLSLPDWIKTLHSPFDEYSLSQPNIPSRVMKEAQISVDFIDLAGEDFQLDDLTGEHPDSMDVEDMIAKTLETHSSHSPTPELQFPPSPLILSSSPPPSSPQSVICQCEFALDAHEDDINQHVLHKAWERLQDWNGLTPDGKMEQTKPADVNFEAICLLDKIMFDTSVWAGLAGNHRWGLDAGPHEGGDDPQLVGPSVTPDELKQKGNDEEEIVHGLNFKHDMESYNDLREDLDQEHGKKELRGAKKWALSNAAKGKGAAKRQRKM